MIGLPSQMVQVRPLSLETGRSWHPPDNEARGTIISSLIDAEVTYEFPDQRLVVDTLFHILPIYGVGQISRRSH